MQHKQCKMHINNVKSPLRPYQTVQFRSCNLKCNSTLRSCKISNIQAPSQLTNIFLTCQTFVTNLHLLRVELRCELQEKIAPCDRAFNLTQAVPDKTCIHNKWQVININVRCLLKGTTFNDHTRLAQCHAKVLILLVETTIPLEYSVYFAILQGIT